MLWRKMKTRAKIAKRQINCICSAQHESKQLERSTKLCLGHSTEAKIFSDYLCLHVKFAIGNSCY